MEEPMDQTCWDKETIVESTKKRLNLPAETDQLFPNQDKNVDEDIELEEEEEEETKYYFNRKR